MPLKRCAVAQDKGINVLLAEVRAKPICRLLRRCATSETENNDEYEYAVHIDPQRRNSGAADRRSRWNVGLGAVPPERTDGEDTDNEFWPTRRWSCFDALAGLHRTGIRGHALGVRHAAMQIYAASGGGRERRILRDEVANVVREARWLRIYFGLYGVQDQGP